MSYSDTLSLNCPHCNTRCQFVVIEQGHRRCVSDDKHHIPYICTNCNGLIATKWTASGCDPQSFRNGPNSYYQSLNTYYPVVGDWNSRVKLELITNKNDCIHLFEIQVNTK